MPIISCFTQKGSTYKITIWFATKKGIFCTYVHLQIQGRSLRQSVNRINAKTFEPVRHERVFFTAGFGEAIRSLEKQSEAYWFIHQAVENFHEHEASLITPQYTVEKGLKVFGEKGTAAVIKELT